MHRRRFLECSGIVLLAEFLALPVAASVARNDQAFAAGSPDSVYAALGVKAPESSTSIRIVAPDIAENGARVPIEVHVDLPNPQRLLLVGEKNLLPLFADVRFLPKGLPSFEATVKLAETSNVRAIVSANGRWYTATRSVRVIAGGCLPG